MLLIRRTSELSVCSIGRSSSCARARARGLPSRAISTSLSVSSASKVDRIGGDRRAVAALTRRRRRSSRRRRAAPARSSALRASTGTTFICGVELDLVERGAARRVVERDHEAAVAHQQRHHAAAARRRRSGSLRSASASTGNGVDVDQRIAHLARQRGLQVLARDDAHAHQQLAERHAAVVLLLRPARPSSCASADHAEREQRLADAHHRHLGLRARSPRAAARARRSAASTRMSPSFCAAQLAPARRPPRSTCSQVARVLLDQHLADARADLEARCRRARGTNMRLTLPSSSHGGNRNRPKSVSTWPMVSPFSSPPPASVHAGRRAAGAVAAAGRRAGRASGSGSGCSGVGQGQRAELVEAQRHGGARRRHLHVRDRVLGHEEGQARRGRPCSSAPVDDLAGQRSRSARSAPGSWRTAASAT